MRAAGGVEGGKRGATVYTIGHPNRGVAGFTGLPMGAWQVVNGRRDLKPARVVIVLYLIFMAAGLIARLLS